MSVITATAFAPANIQSNLSLTQQKLDNAQLAAWGVEASIPVEGMTSDAFSAQNWTERQGRAQLNSSQLASHNVAAKNRSAPKNLVIDDLDEAVASTNRGIGPQSMMRRDQVSSTNQGLQIHDTVGVVARARDQSHYEWTPL